MATTAQRLAAIRWLHRCRNTEPGTVCRALDQSPLHGPATAWGFRNSGCLVPRECTATHLQSVHYKPDSCQALSGHVHNIEKRRSSSHLASTIEPETLLPALSARLKRSRQAASG